MEEANVDYNLTDAHKLAISRMFLTMEDVNDIIYLVRKTAKNRPFPLQIVDLGAGSGTTALAVYNTVVNPELVDVVTGDINEDNLTWAARNLQGFGIPLATWHAVASDSAKLGKKYQKENKLIDLLLHDADHSEKGLKRDMDAWLPCLASGAYLWVHDYKPMPGSDQQYPGVAHICDDLVRQGVVRQVEMTGIGFGAMVL